MMNSPQNIYWRRKLNALLHDSPDKATDIQGHISRADLLKKLDQFKKDEFFGNQADWEASAADRFPFPSPLKLTQALSEIQEYPHPMGGSSLPVSHFNSADEALEVSQKSRPFILSADENASDPRADFITAWRFWRNWASSIDPRLAHIPADTRIPDHSIWNHLSITTAFQGALPSDDTKRDHPDTDLQPRLLLFSLGPVQDLIAAARSTRDLWSGSYLLSYLISKALGKISLDLGPDHVIFPNLLDQPLVDLQLKENIYDNHTFSDNSIWEGFQYQTNNISKLLTPSLPNRFMALIPAINPYDGTSADAYAQKLSDCIQQELDQIKESVIDLLTPAQLGDIAEFHEHRIDEQVDKALEIHWQILPIPGNVEELDSWMNALPEDEEKNDDGEVSYAPRQALKSIREIIESSLECKPQYPLKASTNWAGLNALIAWLHDGAKSQRSFTAWREGRWQSGKKFNKDSLTGKEEAVLVFSSKEQHRPLVENFCTQQLEMSKGTFKPGEALGAMTLIKRLWWKSRLLQEDILPLNYEDVRKKHPMPNTHSIAKGNPFDDSDEADAQAERDTSEKYFAMLAFDGDQMGKWISGSKSPELSHCLSPKAKGFYQQYAPEAMSKAKRAVTPSWHQQFSEALGNFSFHTAQRIVEAFDGRLIYAGGDDVLAMLPAKDALPCARALRAAFRGEKKLNHLVKGVLTGVNKKKKSDRNTQIFKIQHDGYLQLHPNSGALHGAQEHLLSDPVDFPVIVPGPAADASVGIAIAHYKSPLQDVVKAAQAAEKRAKRKLEDGGLGRGAVAVTLFKRSGEILEWGTKWEGKGKELLDNLIENLTNKKLNGRFPHKLEALLTLYLPQSTSIQTDADFENNFADIIKIEINHCLTRNAGGKLDDDSITLFSAYWNELSGLKNTSFAKKLTLFINLLRTAAWMTRTSQSDETTEA